MKSFFGFIFEIISVLCIGYIGFYGYETFISNKATLCNQNLTYLNKTVSVWMQDMLLSGYNVSIQYFDNFYEYNSSPTLLGTTLYDDLKNNRLCKATAHVKLSDDNGNIIEDEFDIRYQYTTTVPNTQGQYANGIQMCGHDTEQLSKFLNEKTMILMLKKADKND